MSLEVDSSGEVGSLDYRIQDRTKDGKPISLWHDVPLHVSSDSDGSGGKGSDLCNFVCEIPKWTRKKYEIATKVCTTL